MFFLSREKVDEIRNTYVKGTRIRLLHMDDPQAIPPGSEGTVECVDDNGTLHMKWDSGRSLGIVPDEDEFEIITS